MSTTCTLPANRAKVSPSTGIEPKTDQPLSFIVPMDDLQMPPPAIYGIIRGQIRSLGTDGEILFICQPKSKAAWIAVQKLQQKDPDGVRGFMLSDNEDRSTALSLGYRAARGSLVLSIELDLNDDPRELAYFLKKIEWKDRATQSSQRSRNEFSVLAWQDILPRGILRRSPMPFTQSTCPHRTRAACGSLPTLWETA